MKLEVGKKYCNRKGEVREILHYIDGCYSYPFRCKDTSYTKDGRYSTEYTEHDFDLIAEVEEILGGHYNPEHEAVFPTNPPTVYQLQEDGSFILVDTTGSRILTDDRGNVLITEPDRAKRFNSGKVPMHYVPLDMLQGLARVLEDGAVKYGEDNWRKGAPVNEQIDSLLRHLTKLQSGEVCDAESSLPHVDHMLFNCISLRLALEKDCKLEKDPGQGNRTKETK